MKIICLHFFSPILCLSSFQHPKKIKQSSNLIEYISVWYTLIDKDTSFVKFFCFCFWVHKIIWLSNHNVEDLKENRWKKNKIYFIFFFIKNGIELIQLDIWTLSGSCNNNICNNQMSSFTNHLVSYRHTHTHNSNIFVLVDNINENGWTMNK